MIDFANKKSITIPEGEVVSIQFLTNLIGSSIDTDGSVYNGCGYRDGYRLSSSGAEKEYISAEFQSTVTGFIPVLRSDVLYIDDCYWFNTNISTNYICGYDSDFNFIGAKIPDGYLYGTEFVDYITGNKKHTKIVLKDFDNLAYIRMSCRSQLVGQSISGSHIKVSTLSSAITAWEKYLYTNWVPKSTESDGVTIYNGGLGYKNGYRIRSGGAEGSMETAACTGFIPFVKGDKLYIYPAFTGMNTNNAINFYNASYENLGQITDSGADYGICKDYANQFKTTLGDGVSILDLSNNTVSGVENIAFVRITNNNATVKAENMIITKNEEIV